MAIAPLPEVKHPLVVEVALTSAPHQTEPALSVAPQPPQINPVANKQQPKPPEKTKIKPVINTKIKPIAKPNEPKNTILQNKPNKAVPAVKTIPTFNPPPIFIPAPAKASPSPALAPKPQPLVKAAYSAPGLKNPPTRYPKIAQMRQWEGIVTLEVRVLANGSAGEVKIVNSSGHEILDESAVEQVKSWHFIPAHQGDKTVEDWVRVPISFKFKR
jgi:protein TonB